MLFLIIFLYLQCIISVNKETSIIFLLKFILLTFYLIRNIIGNIFASLCGTKLGMVSSVIHEILGGNHFDLEFIKMRVGSQLSFGDFEMHGNYIVLISPLLK